MAIQTVGVLGCGLMGSGIAQVSAQAGYAVLLSDVDVARAEKGKAGIARQLDQIGSRGDGLATHCGVGLQNDIATRTECRSTGNAHQGFAIGYDGRQWRD